MKRKNKLRVLEILCIISLLFTIFSIRRTYARYFEKVDTTYQTHIKRWLIKINDLNIHEAKSLSEVVQPVLVENENMNNNNTLVPGRTGYFDIMIDYTYVDLAFKYEFSIEQLNETQLKDFEIYGYEIVDGDKSTVTETKQIKGVIDPDKDLNSANEKKRDIRILFRWNDGDGSIMDNKLDTQYRSEENEALNYRATLKFTQYIESENP